MESNLHPPFGHRTALVGGLAVCAVLAGAAFFGVPASAQTTPPAQTTTSTPSASPTSSAQRPDSAIAEDINAKLMASNTLRPLDLGIWVHNGTATLTGTVPTQDLRDQAVAMVKAVNGVQNVEDKVTIGVVPATAPGFSGQNDNGQGVGHPGDAQGPPPPPPAGYGQNQNAPSPQSPPSAPSPQSPPPAHGANPRPAMVTVAPNTPIYVMVMQTLDSKHTEVGQRFHAILVQDVVVQNGTIAIPRGADVFGTVVDARGPGHLKGRPHLALQLTGLNVANSTYPLSSYIWARGGPGKGGQSAANIGGGTLAGAMVGGAVGGGDAALLGGLLGGLGGAGLSSLWSGPQLLVPAESVLTFYLNAPLTVREPNEGEIRMLASHVPPAAYRRPGYGRRYPPPPGYYPPPPGGPPGGYPY